MLGVFSSWLARTSEEVATTVSASNLSFFQNLSKEEKFSLLFEVTYNMYQESLVISLAVAGREMPWLLEILPWKGTLGKGNVKL